MPPGDCNDLTFAGNYGTFNFRVGAIIIRDRKLLMVKNASQPYYYTVGGRVKLNESSADAVRREAEEETGVDYEVDRLAFVHEHFFLKDRTGVRYHELAFFYLMKPGPRADMICNSFTEDGVRETLHWLPLDRLGDYWLYPEFFKTRLTPAALAGPGTHHIVTSS